MAINVVYRQNNGGLVPDIMYGHIYFSICFLFSLISLILCDHGFERSG